MAAGQLQSVADLARACLATGGAEDLRTRGRTRSRRAFSRSRADRLHACPVEAVNAMSRMSPPHAGHTSRNASAIRASRLAHARREVSWDRVCVSVSDSVAWHHQHRPARPRPRHHQPEKPECTIRPVEAPFRSRKTPWLRALSARQEARSGVQATSDTPRHKRPSLGAVTPVKILASRSGHLLDSRAGSLLLPTGIPKERGLTAGVNYPLGW